MSKRHPGALEQGCGQDRGQAAAPRLIPVQAAIAVPSQARVPVAGGGGTRVTDGCPRASVHGDDGVLVRRRRCLVDGFAVSGDAGSSLFRGGVSLRLPNSTGPRSRSRIARRALRAGRNEGLAPSLWCHPRRVDDNHLRAALPLLPADARDQLHRLLIRDQPDSDAIAKQLLQRRTSGAVQLAELVDMLTIDDEARRPYGSDPGGVGND